MKRFEGPALEPFFVCSEARAEADAHLEAAEMQSAEAWQVRRRAGVADQDAGAVARVEEVVAFHADVAAERGLAFIADVRRRVLRSRRHADRGHQLLLHMEDRRPGD